MLLQYYVVRVLCCCVIMLLQYYVIRVLHYCNITTGLILHTLIINILQLSLSSAYNFTITIYILLYDTD